MPRRKRPISRRTIEGDPKYGISLIQRLMNVIMWRGKKNVARKIVYDAIDILVKKSQGNTEKALELFASGLDAITPRIEVRPRRVGGSVYQIPMEVNQERGLALAMRWLIGAAKVRTNKSMGERLAYELLDAIESRGGAVKKRTDVHRMAEANRAFSHYAW